MSLLAPIYNDIRTLINRWTATKAGFIDSAISACAQSSIWTATKASFVDAAISSRAAASTALSNAVWTNALATKLNALSASPLNGNIQRGVITLGSFSASETATISAVTTGKAELRLLGVRTSATAINEALVNIVLTNSTTITATRSASGSNACYVSWELTHYV